MVEDFKLNLGLKAITVLPMTKENCIYLVSKRRKKEAKVKSEEDTSEEEESEESESEESSEEESEEEEEEEVEEEEAPKVKVFFPFCSDDFSAVLTRTFLLLRTGSKYREDAIQTSNSYVPVCVAHVIT